jgi:branched-chain amino acid transport system ATP-binding protein
VLQFNDLTTAYQGLVAVAGISIEVDRGEIVCVAGANGAGKSTLLKSIAGLEGPRSGTIVFDGTRSRPKGSCRSSSTRFSAP